MSALTLSATFSLAWGVSGPLPGSPRRLASVARARQPWTFCQTPYLEKHGERAHYAIESAYDTFWHYMESLCFGRASKAALDFRPNPIPSPVEGGLENDPEQRFSTKQRDGRNFGEV